MFYFNAPALLDNRIGLVFKLYHWRQVCRNGVGGPNLSMDNTIQRPAKLFDCTQAGQAILSIAQRQNMFDTNPSLLFTHSSYSGTNQQIRLCIRRYAVCLLYFAFPLINSSFKTPTPNTDTSVCHMKEICGASY